MMQRSRQPSISTVRSSRKPKSEPENKVPFFDLKCVHSEYPTHLLVGQTYRLRPNDKHDGEVFTYGKFGPHWLLIGLFPLASFDVTPVRSWVAAMKQKEEGNGRTVRSRSAG